MDCSISISARNLKLTNRIRRQVRRRCEVLERYLKKGDQLYIDLMVEKITNHHQSGEIFKAEYRARFCGKELVAIETRESIFQAIDEAGKVFTSELQKCRTKKQSQLRKGARALKAMFRGYE